MKLGCVDTYQNFRANLDVNNQKPFLSNAGDAVSGIADVVTDAADTFENVVNYTSKFSDFPNIDINSLTSPEQLPVELLESKVIENEKAPNMLRKVATYVTTALAAGIAFFAASKTPYTVKTFANKVLSKSGTGTKILNSLVSMKHSVSKLANNFGIEPVKNALGKFNNFCEEKLPQKITNILRRGAEITKLDKLKNWTIDDYARNLFATFMGYKAGRKFYNKHQDKVFMNPNPAATAEQTPKTDEVKEAA